jgi:hypothetical protein
LRAERATRRPLVLTTVNKGVVYLKGLGPIQRRIRSAFIYSRAPEMSTAELFRFCYPRESGPPLRKHRAAICRAAMRVATRVRRDRPGGVVFRARS